MSRTELIKCQLKWNLLRMNVLCILRNVTEDIGWRNQGDGTRLEPSS